MKKNIVSTFSALFICFASFAQSAKENTSVYPTPKWISDKGYWVVESNVHMPDKSIVYFYTNDNVLVYKEKLEGMVLNLKRRKTKMNLKQVLEQSVYAYEKNHRFSEDESWVAGLIKK
jgi:hypothetical protein